MLPSLDAELVQIVDAALADATRRAGRTDGSSWLACRPGCTPCCHGVFRISKLDAERLRAGLAVLSWNAPAASLAIQTRAQQLVERLRPAFPGDGESGLLFAEDESSADGRTWEAFADLPESDAACPVLHPETGRCELYASRPLTCRIFGPPVEQEGGVACCELCYRGATEQEAIAGEMVLSHHTLEEELDREAGEGETVIAWALLCSQG